VGGWVGGLVGGWVGGLVGGWFGWLVGPKMYFRVYSEQSNVREAGIVCVCWGLACVCVDPGVWGSPPPQFRKTHMHTLFFTTGYRPRPPFPAEHTGWSPLLPPPLHHLTTTPFTPTPPLHC
jgi:hypothetical protein